jgi:hypothetical protein
MAPANPQHSAELERRYDELYDRFGKPLEAAHYGEYLAVSPDGRTVLGRTLLEVTQKAHTVFGPGNFLFKIGEKAVGKWR